MNHQKKLNPSSSDIATDRQFQEISSFAATFDMLLLMLEFFFFLSDNNLSNDFESWVKYVK